MEHEHIYHPGKKQIMGPGGQRYHPSVKESWMSGLFCACGAECPADEEPAVREALAATARLRVMRWGTESAVQARLWPEPEH